MKWVTWETVGVDRMACAWLIRRFIDMDAEFVFVKPGQSLPDDAEAFDVLGARLSHRKGHCTFYTMLTEYNLTDATLQRIAHIVDEADVVQEIALESAAQGVDLICRGLRRISPDDTTALAHGALIYDALYAELAADHP